MKQEKSKYTQGLEEHLANTKIGEGSIRCDECAFCENCEDRCIANYQHEGKCVHLKSCEYLQWNTMSDKVFFLQECLPYEYKN